jgi:hypothetical protein
MCETNLMTDVYNCGGCASPCSAMPGLAPACILGSCGTQPCNMSTRFRDCDGNVFNGCEADTQIDPNNCGACGSKCPTGLQYHGAFICRQGQCILDQCSPGYGNCDGNPSNGCETSLLTDKMHCGSCNAICVATMDAISVSCQSGRCRIDACKPPWQDCDGQYNNGCEVDLSGDPQNCRVCGNACPIPARNTTPTCLASTCGSQCAPGYADCDKNPANGCEVLLTSDPRNCGTCGNVCASQSCVNMICQ